VKVSGKKASRIVDGSTLSAGAIGMQVVILMSVKASLVAMPPIPSHKPQIGV